MSLQLSLFGLGKVQKAPIGQKSPQLFHLKTKSSLNTSDTLYIYIYILYITYQTSLPSLKI